MCLVVLLFFLINSCFILGHWGPWIPLKDPPQAVDIFSRCNKHLLLLVCYWKGPFSPNHLDCPMYTHVLFVPLTILVLLVKCGVHKGSWGNVAGVVHSAQDCNKREPQGLSVPLADPTIKGSQVSQEACVQFSCGKCLCSQNLSDSRRHFVKERWDCRLLLACCPVLTCLHLYSALIS